MLWLWHFLGFDYGLPYGHIGAYNAWSGFLSDVGEVAIVGAVYGMLRKHMCHQGRCWRIGRHVVEGTPWCNKHHQAARPAPKPRLADPVAVKVDRLADSVAGLAQAIRSHLAADAQVSEGAGSNPAQSAGLAADERVAPPSAATKRTTTKGK